VRQLRLTRRNAHPEGRCKTYPIEIIAVKATLR
jgi:hypothetical protein